MKGNIRQTFVYMYGSKTCTQTLLEVTLFPSTVLVGDRVNEDVLIQNSFGDVGGGFGGVGGDLSPRLHPKSMDAVLGRYQVSNQL